MDESKFVEVWARARHEYSNTFADVVVGLQSDGPHLVVAHINCDDSTDVRTADWHIKGFPLYFFVGIDNLLRGNAERFVYPGPRISCASGLSHREGFFGLQLYRGTDKSRSSVYDTFVPRDFLEKTRAGLYEHFKPAFEAMSAEFETEPDVSALGSR